MVDVALWMTSSGLEAVHVLRRVVPASCLSLKII